MNFGRYSVTEVELANGSATNGFTAKLCKDGKPIAVLTDLGEDTPCQFTWLDTDEAKRFVNYVRSQPAEASGFNLEPWGTEWDMSLFAAALVDQQQFDADVRERCQTKTLYRLKGDDPNTYRELNHPYDHRSRKHLEDMYNDQLEEIANESL
jgi:hypothetical protein